MNTVITLDNEHATSSHSILFGYLLWIFGFLGAHRFYYGKPISGTIWFLTFGLFGVGWLLDVFFIPGLKRQADLNFKSGRYSYDLTWVLLTFFGIFGVHRFYLGKIWTGLFYFFTAGLLSFGILYDFWTINDQVNELN